MKISNKFKQKSKLYKRFCISPELFSWTNEDLLEAYLYESTGVGEFNKDNGYMSGKKWLDVQIAQWKECLTEGLTTKYELYQDFGYDLMEELGIVDFYIQHPNEHIEHMRHINKVPCR